MISFETKSTSSSSLPRTAPATTREEDDHSSNTLLQYARDERSGPSKAIAKKKSFFGRRPNVVEEMDDTRLGYGDDARIGNGMLIPDREDSKEKEDRVRLRTPTESNRPLTPPPPLPLPPLPLPSSSSSSDASATMMVRRPPPRQSSLLAEGSYPLWRSLAPLVIDGATSSTRLPRSPNLVLPQPTAAQNPLSSSSLRQTSPSTYSPLAAFFGSPRDTATAVASQHVDGENEVESYTATPVSSTLSGASAFEFDSSKWEVQQDRLNRIDHTRPRSDSASFSTSDRGERGQEYVEDEQVKSISDVFCFANTGTSSSTTTPTLTSSLPQIDHRLNDYPPLPLIPSPSASTLPTSTTFDSLSSAASLDPLSSIFDSSSPVKVSEYRSLSREERSMESGATSIEAYDGHRDGNKTSSITESYRKRLDDTVLELDKVLDTSPPPTAPALTPTHPALTPTPPAPPLAMPTITITPQLSMLERIMMSSSPFLKPILVSFLRALAWNDIVALRKVSTLAKVSLEVEAKEFVLQRYLAKYGYRSFVPSRGRSLGAAIRGRPTPGSKMKLKSNTSNTAIPLPVDDMIRMELRNVDAFMINQLYTPSDFHKFAKAHLLSSTSLRPEAISMIRASTRAWNRLVLRLRDQEKYERNRLLVEQRFEFDEIPANERLYISGRAVILRVWLPCSNAVMVEEDAVACERELWKAEIWDHIRRGDIVVNTAINEFANDGKSISDGRYLRNLHYDYDKVGHLPDWLNSLAFPPDYFHRRLASNGDIIHACLHSFVKQVKENLTLCSDQVAVSSPRAAYIVKRSVYRAGMQVRPGAIVSCLPGGGEGPGGLDVVDEDWVGRIIVECEGTKEGTELLLSHCGSEVPVPFKVIREKSRPGEIWLRPIATNSFMAAQ